jgi:hypothetical protein
MPALRASGLSQEPIDTAGSNERLNVRSIRGAEMKRMLWMFMLLLSVQKAGLADAKSEMSSGTILLITLKNSVSSKTASPGDTVLAEVVIDAVGGNGTLIPKGTVVIGRVAGARRAGRLARSGQLDLSFDELVFTDGRRLALKAGVERADEFHTQQDGTIVADSQPLRQVTQAARGGAEGTLVGLGAGISSGRWRTMRSTARVGLVGGVVIGMLHRGDEVVLQAGSTVTLKLIEPLDSSKAEGSE